MGGNLLLCLQGLNGALRDLGVEFEGREHSGIVDARNTARLVWKMVQDGCRLTLNPAAGEDVIPGSPAAENTERKPLNNEQSAANIDTPASSRHGRKKKYYGNRIYKKESLANVKIQAPD